MRIGELADQSGVTPGNRPIGVIVRRACGDPVEIGEIETPVAPPVVYDAVSLMTFSPPQPEGVPVFVTRVSEVLPGHVAGWLFR